MNIEKDLDRETKATINPYRTAAGLILSRIRWDLHPFSWISRSRIKAWKNRFLGQKAIIICNGPSLNKVDFNDLDKYKIFTFGLNKINLLFTRTDFRPSVIVAVNPYVIEQNAEFYNKTDLPLFLDSNGRKWVKFRKNIHFLHSAGGNRQFARDCSISINQGHTVTYVAMQLAFHMGFKIVGLIGCDHSFATKGPANKTVISGEKDPNHFDPNYFAGGVKWQLPDLASSELHYEVARDIFERYGRKIINCTDGGNLEVFERQPLNEFLRL
ncbi:MAG: hypothetical protein B5M53_07030 [Candidatus Cloacimonas sp. 4484_209]|nr:MAG: hypothetical protein B5M53_07030 [Candidatus Cloacimonas sp. 4484_209]RKY43108.1 MAG: hypothetical protein DRP81_07195 [Candidatus Omnitrophota bacterium]